MLSRFHLIPERYGRTDRRTDLLYQYRMLTRDKNYAKNSLALFFLWTRCSFSVPNDMAVF